jgi:hypothetical protein
MKKSKADHVERTALPGKQSASKQGRIEVIEMPKLEPGIHFTRMLKCLGVARGGLEKAVSIAEMRYSNDQKLISTMKAAVMFGEVSDLVTKVPIATTSDYAGALAAAYDAEQTVFGDFLEYLRPQTVSSKSIRVLCFMSSRSRSMRRSTICCDRLITSSTSARFGHTWHRSTALPDDCRSTRSC